MAAPLDADATVLRSAWTPLQLNCGVVLRNRFVLAPMTTDASEPDGTVSQAELRYIERRSANRFAAGITSCAYVADDGRAWQGIGAAHAGHLDSLRAVAAAFHGGGGLAILQLYDGGRLAHPPLVAAERLRAPSAVPSVRPGALTPRELTAAEVDDLRQAFVQAARLGEAAGFDGIELHGANHYLLHQFFSPRANRRGDRWGGSLANRARFPLEVVAAVRAALSDRLIVGFRVTPFEAEADGYTLEEASAYCALLAGSGIDYLHISMDDFRKRSPQREDRDWTAADGQQEDRNPITVLAAAVNRRCAVIASGGIKTVRDVRDALEAGADLVAIGRASLIDPEWLAKIEAGDLDAIRERLPATSEQIEAELTIPARMVRYLLSRPGWIPREPVPV